MKRRWYALAVMVAAVLAVGVWVASTAAAADIVKGPYLQNVQPDRVTVMWETEDDEEGVVEFGPSAALGRRVAAAAARRVHEVTLKGLTPRTMYHYRVRAGRAVSEPATFTTSFHGDGAFSFAVYGDNRSFPGRHAHVVTLIRSRKPDFVLHTGDLVDVGFDKEGWDREFFGPAAPLMRSCCVWPVLGNHEEDADQYFDLFSLPKPERWYAFRWGNARFIGLDSNSDLSADSEQVRWLAGELKRRKVQWTFVYLHHPAYSAGPHGPTMRLHDALVPLIEQHRVDLVFAGHNHLYERSYPMAEGDRSDTRGVVYVTTAGGGAPLYGFRPQSWTAAGASQLHACFVRVDGPNLRLEARGLDGRLLDDVEMTKDPGRVDRLLAALRSPGAATAAAELGRLGAVRAMPRLVALMRRGSAPVRRAAAEAIARLNTPAGVTALAADIRDSDPTVRRFAVRGLARSQEAEHVPAVVAALDDADQAVVAEAILGLAWIDPDQAEKPLVRFINRPGIAPALRLKAVEGVAQLRSGWVSRRDIEDASDAERLFIELLERPDLEVAREGAKGLKEHNSPAARQALCMALRRPGEPNSKLQDEFDEAVLKTLKKTADRSCGDALIRFVADATRRAKNRERAADVLDRITGLDLNYDPLKPTIDLEAAVRRWRTALKEDRR